jgi:hypothetical protein
MILDYINEGNIPLRILSCEMVHSTRTTKPKSVSAHVVIDAIDKEKVFNPDYWPESRFVYGEINQILLSLAFVEKKITLVGIKLCINKIMCNV